MNRRDKMNNFEFAELLKGFGLLMFSIIVVWCLMAWAITVVFETFGAK